MIVNGEIVHKRFPKAEFYKLKKQLGGERLEDVGDKIGESVCTEGISDGHLTYKFNKSITLQPGLYGVKLGDTFQEMPYKPSLWKRFLVRIGLDKHTAVHTIRVPATKTGELKIENYLKDQ